MMGNIQKEKVVFDAIKGWRGELYVKREDLIHPFISGNKYRKLKYNLQEARENGFKVLLTFGGAFSNHLSALSFAGKEHGFSTIGVVRGDELGKDFPDVLKENSTLRFAHLNGMKFKFVSREEYRKKASLEFIESLKREFGKFYLVPEGGTNALAIKGCEEILDEADAEFNQICVAIGTGGTISGLINSAGEGQQVIGFPSLKGEFLTQEIQAMTGSASNWWLNHKYHFGGYAKVSEKLISFINQFYQQTNIPLDPVYTGKMMYGVIDMIQKGEFGNKNRILAIHTGGLQGIQGMNKKLIRKKLPVIKT